MIRISGPMLKSSLQHLLMSTQQQNVFHNNCVFVCIMHHFGLMAHESWRMEKTKWKRFCCCFNQHWQLRALEASSQSSTLLPIVVLKRKKKFGVGTVFVKGSVVAPSPKIVINLPRTYESYPVTENHIGLRDPSLQTKTSCFIPIL